MDGISHILIRETDHFRGDLTSPVELVEFVDFECPWCNNSNYMVNQLFREFRDKIKYVFKHFPNTRIHQKAKICAYSAEAASNQNMFWEMHDSLLRYQKSLNWECILDITYELKIDQKQFLADVRCSEVENRVKSDFDYGRSLGVYGTPFFLINGERHAGDWRYESLRNSIRKELAEF